MATAIEKSEKPNELMSRGSRRPYSSEIGAHTMGPVANPRTYSDKPRVPTSSETPYSSATAPMPDEKMDEPKAAVSVT